MWLSARIALEAVSVCKRTAVRPPVSLILGFGRAAALPPPPSTARRGPALGGVYLGIRTAISQTRAGTDVGSAGPSTTCR